MNAFIGIILYLVYLFCFITIISSLYNLSELNKEIVFKNKSDFILGFIIVLIGVGINSLLLHKNDFIYYWDYCMHWAPAVEYSKILFEDPISALKYMYSSISQTDYNATMPFLYSGFVRMFGDSFVAVIIEVNILFMIPTYYIITCTISKVFRLTNISLPNTIIIFGIVNFIPIIINVLLKGFLDAPVLMISTLCIALVLDLDYKQVEFKKLFILSLSFIILSIFRRHWMYWLVAMTFFMVVIAILKFDSSWIKQLKLAILSAFFILFVYIMIMVIFFMPYIKYSMRNYSGLYVAYNGTIFEKLNTLFGAFGILLISQVLFIPIIIVRLKKKSTLILSFICLEILPFILMSSTIIMHDAHFYMLVLPILMIDVIGSKCLIDTINIRYIQKFILAFIVVLFFINYSYYCFPTLFNPQSLLIKCGIGTQWPYQVLYRSDISEIKTMVQDLNNYSDMYNSDIYVCAADNDLNYALLQYAFEPNSWNALNRGVNGSYVDLRDGFSTNFFDAGIVVIESPISKQLSTYGKGIYGVSYFLSEQILDPHSTLGRHYEHLKDYSLQNGITGGVYRRINNWDGEDYDFLINFYDELYPNNKDIFSKRIIEYRKNH